MKKHDYSRFDGCKYRQGLLMFTQVLEEVLFYYSYESYKLPALNGRYLCLDILNTKGNIDRKSITEGNFVPLAEEFENMIENDVYFKLVDESNLSDVLLKKRDKNGVIIDYKKFDNKAKISKYSELASFLAAQFDAYGNCYLHEMIEFLYRNILADEYEYDNFDNICCLTKALATELVNSGYSVEHIYHTLTNIFIENNGEIVDEKQLLDDFFSKFTFKPKTYKVSFGINRETASYLKHIDNLEVIEPTYADRKKLKLHRKDYIARVKVESLDEFKATKEAFDFLEIIIGLHRISQHHRPVSIQPTMIVDLLDDEENLISTFIVSQSVNVLHRAINESQVQSLFYDDQLLNNIKVPNSFYRAVSLHNNAIDSNEKMNQLLDLWTAIEVLIEFKQGDEEKINVISNCLTSILNRTYLYRQIEQLYKDLAAVLNAEDLNIIGNIGQEERMVVKLAKLLSVKTYETQRQELLDKLNDYPILQYRINTFSRKIFVNSQSVYNELKRHKDKIKWQIMRIYRNRNMIVHDGRSMPYLEVILGNLHYYVDSLIDTLIEYYHLQFSKNNVIYMDVEKRQEEYWNYLGLDDKGKIKAPKEIDEDNYLKILFNDYEGNFVKNIIEEAIKEQVAE